VIGDIALATLAGAVARISQIDQRTDPAATARQNARLAAPERTTRRVEMPGSPR
jgi:tRNA A58 N-methylase Trm61